jgi:two-component system, cell cycle sensor histidine kinase PleC
VNSGLSLLQEAVPERHASDAARRELALRHLEITARYLYTNFLPLPVVIGALVVLLSRWHPAATLVAWAGATVFPWVVLIIVLRVFLNDSERDDYVVEWTAGICAALLLATIAFVLVAPVFWVEGDRLNNVLLYVVLAAGLACAGAQSAPSVPVAATNIAPYAFTFLYLSLRHEPYPINLGMAFLQFCFVVLVLLYSKAVWQLTHEMLLLREERKGLIGRLETALAETDAARARAENASQAKSQFLANMSHELRTPLNAVLGFSEMIRDRVLGDGAVLRYSEYAGDVHKSAVHLLNLINDILDLSKIEAGKLELKESCFDLVNLGAETLQLLKQQAERRGVSLVQEGPRTLDVFADQRALRQILVNLLSNAVKFTPAGGRVVLRSIYSPNELKFSIEDTGIGIRPEDLDGVMETFRQGRHDIKANNEEGTGLGLAIVKALAELHGGSVAIESALGQGTTVTVTVPVSRLVQKAADMQAA